MEPATQLDVDVAVRAFIATLVRKEMRVRVASLFLPLRKRARPADLLAAVRSDAVFELTSERARRLDRQARGIWFSGAAAFVTTCGAALALNADETVFIASSGAFGLYTYDVGGPTLITRRA
jgi:hypothetical protein